MNHQNNNHKYDSILYLPHHVSATRAPMPMSDRAAQFSPFAALTGFDAAIAETGRLTQEKIELDEEQLCLLNRKLQLLMDDPAEREVTLTFFRPDSRKDGGAYVTVTGFLKKVDSYERIIVMTDGTKIPMEDVCHIVG